MNEFPSITDMVEQWQTVRLRTVLAQRGGEGTEQPADYWSELRIGAEIAREVTAGQWCVVANLLRLGAVESWFQVSEALGEIDARDGFTDWISNQRNLYDRTGSLGLSPAEAEELHRLAEAVA